MLFLESYVNIKDGKEEKVVYVKEENFVAIVRAQTQEADLTAFLYSLLDELTEDLSLSEFDELIARKIQEMNLPVGLDFSCGWVKTDRLYIKTVNKGVVFGKRGSKIAKIIGGDKSAVGYLKEGDVFIFSFEGFQQDYLLDIKKENFVDIEQEEGLKELKIPFIASFVENLEEEKKASFVGFPKIASNSMDFLKRKYQLLAFGLVVLFLLFSVYIGYKRRQERKISQRVSQVKEDVNALLRKAEDEAILSSIKAKEYFSQAEEKLRDLEESLPASKKYLAEELKRDLEQKRKRILKESKKNVEEFFDFKLIDKDLKVKLLSYSSGKVFFLSKGNKIFSLDLETKSYEQLNLKNLNDPKAIGAGENKAFVLAEKGIYEVFKDSPPKLLVEKSDEWKRIIDFKVYGKNFYLLDFEKKQVLKHTPIESGYSDAIEYLKDKVPSLEKDSELVIDGAIYIITKNRIYKYFQGEREAFNLNLPAEEFEISKAYTDKDLDLIYLLDKSSGRIFVIEKETKKMKEQIENRLISKANSFFVYESQIYLLVQDKIYLLK